LDEEKIGKDCASREDAKVSEKIGKNLSLRAWRLGAINFLKVLHNSRFYTGRPVILHGAGEALARRRAYVNLVSPIQFGIHSWEIH
jgi:hypothetical protein